MWAGQSVGVIFAALKEGPCAEHREATFLCLKKSAFLFEFLWRTERVRDFRCLQQRIPKIVFRQTSFGEIHPPFSGGLKLWNPWGIFQQSDAEWFRKWSKKSRWEWMNPSPHVNQAVVKLFVEPLRRTLHYLIAKMGTRLQNIMQDCCWQFLRLNWVLGTNSESLSRIWWLQKEKRIKALFWLSQNVGGVKCLEINQLFCPSAPQFPVEKTAWHQHFHRTWVWPRWPCWRSLQVTDGRRDFGLYFFLPRYFARKSNKKAPQKWRLEATCNGAF